MEDNGLSSVRFCAWHGRLLCFAAALMRAWPGRLLCPAECICSEACLPWSHRSLFRLRPPSRFRSRS
eukprot:1390651-Alexandrium_andersonii.AAC.1